MKLSAVRKHGLAALVLVVAALLGTVACGRRRGPMEQAGHDVDHAAQDVDHAVDEVTH